MRRLIAAVAIVLACAAWLAWSYYFSRRVVSVAVRLEQVEVLEVPDEYYQGLAYYAGKWYFSDREYLAVTSDPKARRPELENELPIPYDLVLEGYNHIGDIDVEDGKVYAPLEDVNYEKPLVAVYDAKTLKLLSTIGPLAQSHAPWCAVDPDKGLIYSSEFDGVDRVFVYDMEGRKVREVRLNATLSRVQGGDVEGGLLYLSADDGGDSIYLVDLETGAVVKVAEVKTPHEMEGIEVVGDRVYVLVGTRRGLRNLLFVLKVLRKS